MEQELTPSYICIDLKSFYASVECIERGLDPLKTNLVVADSDRTEKTICLAVSPSLKSYGIPGRARLFEVVQRINQVNAERLRKTKKNELEGSSYIIDEIKNNSDIRVSYIVATPRMSLYMKYSTKIYSVYLKYIAPEDMHIYSIDEVFIDATKYLNANNLTASELAMNIMEDVLQTTGITATAGIGSNLYLAKIAMDIVAKKVRPNKYGVRIAELDEISYRKLLWAHRPLTDFWRVGRGYAKKLEANGLYTMGDIARCSIGKPSDYYNENLLYKLFGVNAELLIDHAWGYEPCTMPEIKSYRSETNSKVAGQVLAYPYSFEKARLVLCEIIDSLSMELYEMGYVTDQLVLNVGYDVQCLRDEEISSKYHGEVTTDRYGRKIPKSAHGTQNLKKYTSSTRLMTEAALKLYDAIVDKDLLVRRMDVSVCIIRESDVIEEHAVEQLDFLTDYDKLEKERENESQRIEKERKIQAAVLDIKRQFGKNAILKGMNLLEGATEIDRNNKIGGHKA